MKVAEYTGGPTLTSGDMNVKDITIGRSPQAMAMVLNILVNSLYTDKPSACWREYGCNAADANIEAGNVEIPIEITLPTVRLPEAVIRDFGHGMNEQTVDEVFCQLGESTKRESNEVTGMMGIGAKAGYAYGDMFTVTTFNEGMKTIYQFFREDSRLRRAKVVSEASDSPEGTEIRIPVSSADIDEFHTKAESTFRYFSVKPIVHGGQIDYKRTNPIFNGKDWRLTCDGKTVAVMGNVGYSLDPCAVTGYDNSPVEKLLEIGIELDFAIGKLDIAANREGLQYTDKTKKAVLEKVRRVLGEVAEVFVNQLSTATCLWDAKKAYAEAFEKMGTSEKQNLRDVIDTKVTWQGLKLNSGRFELEKDGFKHEGGVVSFNRDNYGRRRTRRNPSPSWIWPSDNTVLALNDLPKGRTPPSRLTTFFTNHPGKAIVVFTFATDKAKADYWTALQLEGAPTILLSSIPLTHAANGGSGGSSAHRSKHSARILQLDEAVTSNRHSNKVRSTWWTPADVDLEDGSGVYVEIDKFRVLHPSTSSGADAIEPDDFLSEIATLRSLKLLTGPVYAFKLGEKKQPKKGKGWVPLKKHLSDTLNALVEAHKQEIADYIEVARHSTLLPFNLAALIPESIAKQYLETVKQMSGLTGINKDLVSFLREGDCKPWYTLNYATLPDASFNLNEISGQVVAAYPMLTFYAEGRNGKKALTTVAEYIRMVETNK
jgi:hypothetical protein